MSAPAPPPDGTPHRPPPLSEAKLERDFDAPPPLAEDDTGHRSVPVVRTLVAGGLMGTANLVPGVSGGTMVLVCGLYAHFVDATADITRLTFTRPALKFLAILFAAKVAAMGALGAPVAEAVVAYREWAYSLFVGMTMAGTPVLWSILQKRKVDTPPGDRWVPWVLMPLGAAAVASLALIPHDKSVTDAREYRPESDVVLDAAAGAAAYSAMVLPGVSGGTVKLALGRYEPTVWSIGQAGRWAWPGSASAPVSVWGPILLPYVLGAVAGLVIVSNLLKWLLRRYERAMAGLLLGVLWGSVVPIWPFTRASGPADYAIGAVLAAAGFAAVYVLTLWKVEDGATG